MAAQSTISESKEVFHKEFPFVIPAIYRRIADELLVELHLLSHQKKFKEDIFFCVGLDQIFRELTHGYKPNNHLEKLFKALCNCCGFKADTIIKTSQNTINNSKNINREEINKIDLTNKNSDLQVGDINFKSDNKYYSRIVAIGLYKIIDSMKTDEIEEQEKSNIKACKEIGNFLGFTSERIEKDISLYNSNKDKLNQAIQILKETVEREKKKLVKNNIKD